MPKAKAKPLPKKKVQKPVAKAFHKTVAPPPRSKPTSTWPRMMPKKKKERLPMTKFNTRDVEDDEPGEPETPPPPPPPPDPEPEPEPEPELPETEDPRSESRDELNTAALDNQTANDAEHADQLTEAHRINTELNQNPPMDPPLNRDEVRDELNNVAQANQDLNDEGHVEQIAEAERAMRIFNPDMEVVFVPHAEARDALTLLAQANQDKNDEIHAQQVEEANRLQNLQNPPAETTVRKPQGITPQSQQAQQMPLRKHDVRKNTAEMEKRKQKMDAKLAKKAGR